MQEYDLVVSGGTFDLFHIGHQEFLRYQLKISKRVLLGITSNKYLQNYPKPHQVEDYEIRKKAVEQFLIKENSRERVKIVPIDTPDPSDLKDLKVDALIVTQHTKSGADLINQKRIHSGLPKLKVINYDLIPSSDGLPVSSSRIRRGEINRSGLLFIDKIWMQKILHLPEYLRSRLRQPFGQLIKNNDYDFEKVDPRRVVSVGDIATKTLLDRNILPRIAVVDLIVEREKKFTTIQDLGFTKQVRPVVIENKPGTITPALWREIKKATEIAHSTVIQVIGEEDLAVLPAILLLPLETIIFYGQPKMGLVVIIVDTQIKENASILLKSFK